MVYFTFAIEENIRGENDKLLASFHEHLTQYLNTHFQDISNNHQILNPVIVIFLYNYSQALIFLRTLPPNNNLILFLIHMANYSIRYENRIRRVICLENCMACINCYFFTNFQHLLHCIENLFLLLFMDERWIFYYC